MTEITAPVSVDEYLSYANNVTAKLCRAFGCLHDFDDLRSCGYMGLLEAVDRFDPTKNVTFKQFAYIRISGAVIDGMRGLYAGSKRLTAFKRRLTEATNRLGGSSDSNILAGELGMTLEELNKNRDELNKMCRANFTDLCASTAEDNETPNFGDCVLIFPENDNLIALDEIWAYINANCSDRDKSIMNYIYNNELTLSETGKALGLTESRISQLHHKIINDLRKKLNRSI